MAFKRANPKGVLKSKTTGLRIGRLVDRAFTETVKSGIQPQSSEQRRVAGVFKTLKYAGITVTASQVKAVAPKRDVYTHVDGVGRDRNGEAIAIELKCTTASIKDHKTIYHSACKNMPTITCGKTVHPNSEYVRHQLQVGFATFAAAEYTNGVVVVSCHDGTVLYRLEPAYKHAAWFTKGQTNQTTPQTIKRRSSNHGIMRWPHKTIKGSICGKGIAKIVKGKYAVLSNNAGTAVALRTAYTQMSLSQRTAVVDTLSAYPVPHYSVSPCPNRGWVSARHVPPSDIKQSHIPSYK